MNRPHLLLPVAAAAVALAACNRQEPAPAPAQPASAASSGSAAVTASGPILPPMAASAPTDAQRQAGSQLATQGGGASVPACASCHGPQGEGMPASGFPRIAGQTYAYLVQQLVDSADGKRNNPVMSPIAKAMTEDQRVCAAAYYATLAPGAAAAAASAASGPAAAAVPARPASGGDVARGQQLATVGDESKFVQACANCHGPDGGGSGVLYPYLAGQNAAYITNTLGAWRGGTRDNDPSGAMPVIAKALSDSDSQSVAAYYASLPAPAGARDTRTPASAPAMAGAASAVVSGPRQAGSASQGTQGTGTEQGAPVTGGGQGPGGGGGGSGGGSTGQPTGDSTAASGPRK